MKKLRTLCLIMRDGQVLLGMKKRGFGEGLWNGFGGKVEGEETIEEAARRETLEEVGLTVGKLDKVGIVDFDFDDRSLSVQVHVFTTDDYHGEPIESEEMKPHWFDMQTLPLDKMWPADLHWLPQLLQGKKLKAKFLYDTPSNSTTVGKILSQELVELEAVD
jgi:8-oxo-dGTP pyrophosphatase MutT (NUDIX family)